MLNLLRKIEFSRFFINSLVGLLIVFFVKVCMNTLATLYSLSHFKRWRYFGDYDSSNSKISRKTVRSGKTVFRQDNPTLKGKDHHLGKLDQSPRIDEFVRSLSILLNFTTTRGNAASKISLDLEIIYFYETTRFFLQNFCRNNRVVEYVQYLRPKIPQKLLKQHFAGS